MKTLVKILFVFALSGIAVSAQAQYAAWADGYGGAQDDVTNNVALDDSGNIYVTGSFTSPSINFGGGVTITNTGGWDCFVAKFDPAGSPLWAVRSDGPNANEYGNDIAVDGQGNVYVIGSFDGSSISFDGGTTVLDYCGGSDFFVVKFDAAGVHQWSCTNTTGYWDDYGEGILYNESTGTVYIIGSFNSKDLTIGTTNLINTVPGSEIYDVFTAEYNVAGVDLWAFNPSGTGNDYGMDIANDQTTGDLFITGYFESDILSFGTGSVSIPNSDVTGLTSDIFVVRHATGLFDWYASPDGNDNDIGMGVAVNNSGIVTITGGFFSPVLDFSSGVNLNNYGPYSNSNFLIAQYDPSATPSIQWANTAYANHSPSWNFDDVGKDLATDDMGNVYVTGWYNSYHIDFGLGLVQNSTNNNYSEIFIAAYDATGEIKWLTEGKEVFNDRGTGIEFLDDCPVVTGWYEDDFTNLGGRILTNTGVAETSDFYIAQVCDYGCSALCEDPVEILHTGKGLMGEDDPSWTITVDPNGGTVPRPATICRWNQPGWSYGAPLAATNWISVDSVPTAVDGAYTFERSFFIDSLCVNPELKLCILVDDTAAVYLNGVYLGGAYSMYVPAEINASGYGPFLNGANTLTVVVGNIQAPKMAFDLKGYVCCSADPCENVSLGYQTTDTCCFDIYLENNLSTLDVYQIRFSTASGSATIKEPEIYNPGWTYSPFPFPSVSNYVDIYPNTTGVFNGQFNLCLEHDPSSNPQQIIIEWQGINAQYDTIFCYDTLNLECPEICGCQICDHPIDSITTGPGIPGSFSGDWTLVGAPAGVTLGPAVHMGSIPSLWGAPFPGTNWISYTANGGGGVAPIGTYVYDKQFVYQEECGPNEQPFLHLCIIVDDTAIIKLNDTQVGIADSPQIPAVFDIYSPIYPGNNLLSVGVVNNPGHSTGFNMLGWLCCGPNTSVAENDHIEDVKIYPNPTSDYVNVKSEMNIEMIMIFNHLGQRILYKECPGNSPRIDLSSFVSGMYLMVIQVGDKSVSRKIMVQ